MHYSRVRLKAGVLAPRRPRRLECNVTPVRGMRLRWVVFDAELPSPGVCLLGTRVGVVARVRLQVVRMERFLPRVGQLTTRGPPFVGRLHESSVPAAAASDYRRHGN